MRKVALAFTDGDPDRHRLHRDVVAALNELAGSVVETVTPAVQGTEFSVAHGLGKMPVEYVVLRQDGAGQLVRSSPQKWTKKLAFFTFTAGGGPSARVRIRFR